MRYDSDELQDLLAAEFVGGNLRGAARSRFAALMRRDARLRDKVDAWEQRLYPILLATTPAVSAPRRVWHAIEARVSPRRHASRRWWRAALAACAVLALGLAIVVRQAPVSTTMVAVLSAPDAQPGLLISWTREQAAERRLRVRVLAHPEMPAGTDWQAWLVTQRDRAPISLGLVTTALEQVLEIPAPAADVLAAATAIGVTVEPKGGSKSGRPSGAFLMQGPVLRVDG